MVKAKLVAFVGMPGSGKGTCTDYLAKQHHWPLIHFGNMLYAEMDRRNLDKVKDENWFRGKLREEQGPAVLAKLAAKEAERMIKDGADKIVIDGIYSWSEYRFLNDKFGDALTTIAIAAPRKLRYARALARKDSHRKYTDEAQIRARDITEIEDIEKGGPIAFADYTIVNDGTPEDMLKKVDQILSGLGL